MCVQGISMSSMTNLSLFLFLSNEVNNVNETILPTDGGTIVIAHSITLGDVVISVLLVLVLFVMIYNNFTRRF